MIRLLILTLVLIFSFNHIETIAEPLEGDTPKNTIHQWKEIENHVEKIHVDTHDIEYRRNFIKETRPCKIYHHIRTIVYYCEIHGHTKVETILEKVEHSEDHS
ncbi:hypothetical protein ACFQ4N_01690 [Oceanobacillus iheyensis]|uniref:hypothetical protein n=1 Tax=Oceanobacillus iheyensis TaxID=182710 RepID=UPI00362C9FF4